MRFEPGSDIFQEPENLILLREGEAPSPKVSDMEPEEIDPLFDRNNAGLFLTEGGEPQRPASTPRNPRGGSYRFQDAATGPRCLRGSD